MDTHTSSHTPNTPPASRPYKVVLSLALGLVAVTLTGAVLLIILGNARQEGLQATLTAVHNDYTELQRTTGTDTSIFPLRLADAPHYSAAEDCSAQIVEGVIQPPPNVAPDAYHVLLWGDRLDIQHLPVGADGRWRSEIRSFVQGRSVWVQIVHLSGFYASAPVQLTLSGESCTHNHATLRFVPRSTAN